MRHARMRTWVSRRQRGQALVEFALSVTVLAFLLLGVIEFGMLIYSYIVVVDATDEAASYAAIFPYERDMGSDCPPPCRLNNDSAIVERVFDTSSGNGIVEPTSYFSITVTPDYLHREPCGTVTVSTHYHHSFLTGLFGSGVDLHYETVRLIVPPGGLGVCQPPQ